MIPRSFGRWAARSLALLVLGLAGSAWARDPCRVCRISAKSADGRETMHATFVRPLQPANGVPQRIVVLLHGLGGDATSWLQVQQVRDRFDAAMRSGALPPTTLLIPDGGDGYWSDWADGRRHDATLVVRLVELLEARMDAQQRSPGARHAVVGASMGGFGALSIALQRPDVFEVAVGLSATDLEIAATEAPNRPVYRNVLGQAPWTAILARINPVQLVRGGAGKGQQFWLGWGSAEPRKFAEGGRLLVEAMTAAGLNVTNRVIDGGSHGWDSTWNQLHPWWLDGLIARWRPKTVRAPTAATAAAAGRAAPTTRTVP